MGPSHKNSLGSKFHSSQRPNQGNTFEFTDQLMEQLGTPEMLIKELKAAKLDIATLKNQLEVKEKSVANYRQESNKLKKENTDLKREITELKARLANNANVVHQPPNDLPAAR